MDNNKQKFAQETIDALQALGGLLESIYRRMKSEGYDIINGEIRNLETGELWVPKRKRKWIKKD